MNSTLLDSIMDMLPIKQKEEFALYYDKSLQDADTVSRVEDMIKMFESLIKNPIHIFNQLDVPQLELRIGLLKFILHGDKPHD